MNTLIDLVAGSGPVLLYARGVLLLAVVASFAALVRDPAARHGAWLAALVVLLALPLVAATLSVDLPVLPTVASPSASLSASPSAASPPAGPVASAPITRRPAGVLGREHVDAKSLRTTGVLGLLWAAGALVLAARLARAQWHLATLARHARPAGGTWGALCRESALALSVRRTVDVRLSPDVDGPLLWGVVRPVILLPEAAAAWPDDVRRSVLLHELAHVRRLDAAAGLVADIACVLHWANPFVWLAARRVLETRELACDAAVVRTGVPRADYSDHLLAVARASRVGWPSAPAMAGGGSLRARIVHVLNAPAKSPRSSWMATALGLAIAVPLAALRPVPADAPPPPPARPSEGAQQESASAPPLSQAPRAPEVRLEIDADEAPEALSALGDSLSDPSSPPAPEAVHAVAEPTEGPPTTSSLAVPGPRVPDPSALDLPSVVAPGDAWSFSLDAPAAVYVAIYALDGQLVAVLAQGRFEAGRHEFAFEPTGSGGFVVGARLGATTVRQRVHVVGVPTP